MKRAVIFTMALVASLGVFAQNELAENTTPKTREQIMTEFNSRAGINLKLYPNPVVKFMSVEPQLPNQAGDIKILDIDGNVIGGQHIEAGVNRVNFDLTNYPTGSYMLALYGEAGKLLYVSRFNKN